MLGLRSDALAPDAAETENAIATNSDEETSFMTYTPLYAKPSGGFLGSGRLTKRFATKVNAPS